MEERNSKLLGCRVRFNAYCDYDDEKKLIIKILPEFAEGTVTKYINYEDNCHGIIVEQKEAYSTTKFHPYFIPNEIIDNVEDKYIFEVMHDVNKTVYEHFFKPERFENLKKWMETTDKKIDEIKTLVETNTKYRHRSSRMRIGIRKDINNVTNLIQLNTDKIKAHDEAIAKFKPVLEEREQILKDIAKIKRDMIEQKRKRDSKIRMRSHVHMKEWGFNEKYMRRINRLQQRLNYVETQLPREVIDLID
tara:strand:+ start:947 stop:1690 length:744 start_codon:yes stop_codon:yes gene_type:complete